MGGIGTMVSGQDGKKERRGSFREEEAELKRFKGTVRVNELSFATVLQFMQPKQRDGRKYKPFQVILVIMEKGSRELVIERLSESKCFRKTKPLFIGYWKEMLTTLNIASSFYSQCMMTSKKLLSSIIGLVCSVIFLYYLFIFAVS